MNIILDQNSRQFQEAKAKAKEEFANERIKKMSFSYFPEEKHHPEFKKILQQLLLNNNRKQMGVIEMSWHAMCHFTREFFIPEMEICFEVLLRATPNELVTAADIKKYKEDGNKEFISKMSSDEIKLSVYNEVKYPKVLEIYNSMKPIYDNIDFQISKPLADAINAKFKLRLNVPIGHDIKFVIPNTTFITDGK